MRWLGVDLGERRIGLALSDPLEITAQSYRLFERSNSLRKDLEELKKIIGENEVTGVILGLPKNMDGSEGPMAEKARNFGKQLQELTGLAPIFWDERLSTSSAQRVLIEADLSRRKRKGKVDQVAAAIILQNFLDARQRIKSE